jgi:hypothetical protein
MIRIGLGSGGAAELLWVASTTANVIANRIDFLANLFIGGDSLSAGINRQVVLNESFKR